MKMLLLMGNKNTAQMAHANCAPTDPVYWMHIAFIDQIWERFRATQPRGNEAIEYPKKRLGNLMS